MAAISTLRRWLDDDAFEEDTDDEIIFQHLADEVLAPLAELIKLKCGQEATFCELWTDHEEMWAFLEQTLDSDLDRDSDRDEDYTFFLRHKIDETRAKVTDIETPLAFRTVCEPGSEEHLRYMKAAQYSDEWVCNRSSEGLSAFRSFYICLAKEEGHGWSRICLTVIPSKTWSTFHADPMAFGQRRYCLCCGAKYKQRFGMLIEIELHGRLYYAKADVPPDSVKDLKALWLEETLKPAASGPQDLFDRLKLVTPRRSPILSPISQDHVRPNWSKTKYDPNAYKLRLSAYNMLPHFRWYLILFWHLRR